MAQLLPERWKLALSNLRSDIRRALERRLPSRRSDGQREAILPVKVRKAVSQLRNDITQALKRWLLARRETPRRRGTARWVFVQRVQLRCLGLGDSLPWAVAGEQAQATYKHGPLRISLPKAAWARGKRVQVQIP
jgi:hypothetical protein